MLSDFEGEFFYWHSHNWFPRHQMNTLGETFFGKKYIFFLNLKYLIELGFSNAPGIRKSGGIFERQLTQFAGPELAKERRKSTYWMKFTMENNKRPTFVNQCWQLSSGGIRNAGKIHHEKSPTVLPKADGWTLLHGGFKSGRKWKQREAKIKKKMSKSDHVRFVLNEIFRLSSAIVLK